MKTREEIWAQIGAAIDNPNIYPGMTYADGVQAALRWVLGETDDLPIEEEYFPSPF